MCPNRAGHVERLPGMWTLLFLAAVVTISAFGCSPVSSGLSIVYSRNGSPLETLAAREVRRYLYLRTGQLVAITEADDFDPSISDGVIVGQKDRSIVKSAATHAGVGDAVSALGQAHYVLRTAQSKNHRWVLIAGGDDLGTLYAAYRFAEHLGVRFYLHGDVVPDKQMALELPLLDETAHPLFALRGIQPFHDFPEGPDWWNLDDYKAIISQLPKLGMNFIGFHTYPEGGVGPEPTVWIGSSEDIANDGSVKSSYPARHFATFNGTWGYKPKKTSEYRYGASQLFEHDAYGAEVMIGQSPWPSTPEECNALFNSFAAVLRAAFQHAHALGVATCVGTETPLTVPKSLRNRLAAAGKKHTDSAVIEELYEGIFQRIAKAYPIDYYWFWTPENWTWKGATDKQVKATLDDLRTAVAAAEETKAPFTLATCGWVLGPPQDRALFDRELPKNMPLSCISRAVGKTPVEPGFARVTGRPKWAIPWLEDDPSMTAPQLWVGRMRQDAFDALRYGCTGLMGIHWRTRIVGPNVSALAKAAWDQAPWSDEAARTASNTKPSTQPSLTRGLPTNDFYADWAQTHFGPEAGPRIAALFTKLDGRLPQPAGWVAGPGGIKPDDKPWEQVSKAYDFVDELAAMRTLVEGAGNSERFDYWLNNFQYLRAMAHLNCIWAQFDKSMKKVEAQSTTQAKLQLARTTALPIRRDMIRQLGHVYQHLLATVSTYGEMGTVANWEQHILPTLLTEPGEKLAHILGEPLPADAMPATTYAGPTRIIVPTVRTSLVSGETLKLKVLILAGRPVREPVLRWRSMGTGKFATKSLDHVARGVYSMQLSPGEMGTADLEYYVQVAAADGKTILFPPTAPQINQTVTILPNVK